MWECLKHGVLLAIDEVCAEKRREFYGYTWWWDEEVQEAVSRKIYAHKAMCQNSTEVNKRKYNGMKGKAKKAVSKATR